MSVSFTNFRWNNPITGSDVSSLYAKLYGNEGAVFVSALEDCPYEVAVLSRLAAYVKEHHRRSSYGRS